MIETSQVGMINFSPTDSAIAELRTRLDASLVDCSKPSDYEAARVTAEAARLEALKPDVRKLADWIERVERMSDDMPKLENEDAAKALQVCNKSICKCLGSLQLWIDENAR